MSKEDKIKVVEFLDKKGAFLITKSGDKVCRYLDISKFTLYNYLDEIHSNNTRLEQGRL
jgi:predicted transcriptional regulator YheO